MRFRAKRSLLPSISLLTVVFLLTAGPAFADPPGSMYGKSKGMHSGSGSYGSLGHGMGHGKGYGGHGSGDMHNQDHQKAMKFFKHILKNKEAMSLTDEQVQQLRDFKIDYKKDRIGMKAKVDLAKVDLHALLWDEKSKLADIETQMNKVHALMTKLHIASIKAKRDGKAVLTDEQRARMDTMHKRMKSHGGSMGHPGDSSKEKKCKKSKGETTDGHKK